jgi:hypothetical protein
VYNLLTLFPFENVWPPMSPWTHGGESHVLSWRVYPLNIINLHDLDPILDVLRPILDVLVPDSSRDVHNLYSGRVD